MKKLWVIVLLMGLLTGCGQVETFETLGDIAHVSSTIPQPRQVVLSIPQDVSLEASVSDAGVSMYSCEGYTMVLQTFSSGDLSSTVRSLSGYDPDHLQILETTCSDHTRYDWVWTAAAEEGDMICRCALLDDGNYHYVLYTMALSGNAKALGEDWNDLFASFCLET